MTSSSCFFNQPLRISSAIYPIHLNGFIIKSAFNVFKPFFNGLNIISVLTFSLIEFRNFLISKCRTVYIYNPEFWLINFFNHINNMFHNFFCGVVIDENNFKAPQMLYFFRFLRNATRLINVILLCISPESTKRLFHNRSQDG